MYISENCLYFNEFSLTTIDKIPVGNWLLCQNEMTGEFFLKNKPNFTLPDKIYGDVREVSKKYLNTFSNTDKNLGILLSGMKGTGKSLLARKLCIDSNLPVIIVTDPYKGSGLIDFFTKINQEIVVFLDEFEKIYAKSENQDGLLSLFDGAFPSKFLFLLTINEINKMNSYMINRPGRIHYVKKYEGLQASLIKEILEDMLINKSHIDEVLLCCAYLGEMSMDMLTSFIWECNLYKDESPKKLLKELNLMPESGFYDVEVYRDGKKIAKDSANKTPLSSETIYLEFHINPELTDEQKHLGRKAIDAIIYENRTYMEINWHITECDIVINDDYSIDIKRKNDLPDEDTDNHGISLKYIKGTKYTYTI